MSNTPKYSWAMISSMPAVEDCDPLLKDALAYSREKNVVALASFLEAVSLFCWYKAVEVRAFLALCPHLLQRLDEIKVLAVADDIINKFIRFYTYMEAIMDRVTEG